MIDVKYFDPKTEKNYSKEEFNLYVQYKYELWQISGDHPCSNSVLKEWYTDILQSEIHLIRLFDTEQANKQIGFFVIGVGTSCHTGADFYIWDSFILPDYRRQHYMETVFQAFIKKGGYKGKYCLYILDKNIPAIKFWEKQFKLLGYSEYGIIDYSNQETSWCHLYAYGPEKGFVWENNECERGY